MKKTIFLTILLLMCVLLGGCLDTRKDMDIEISSAIIESESSEEIISSQINSESASSEEFVSYQLEINRSWLDIYAGPSYDYRIVDWIYESGSYTIVEEVQEISQYATTMWGKLEDGRGWINLAEANMEIVEDTSSYISPEEIQDWEEQYQSPDSSEDIWDVEESYDDYEYNYEESELPYSEPTESESPILSEPVSQAIPEPEIKTEIINGITFKYQMEYISKDGKCHVKLDKFDIIYTPRSETKIEGGIATYIPAYYEIHVEGNVYDERVGSKAYITSKTYDKDGYLINAAAGGVSIQEKFREKKALLIGNSVAVVEIGLSR